MGEETFRTHLNSLEEVILDEEKLVTYVSISKDFCIHVNESKCLMNEVVGQIREKQPDAVLNVLYVISGLTEDNKAVTCVCTESDVAKWRKKMKALFFEHIYSINKGNSSVDKVALMAITKFDDYHLCSGLIKSNLCSKRSSEEIDNLKSKSSIVLENDQKSSKPLKKNQDDKPSDVVMNGNAPTKKASEMKIETAVKQEKLSPKKEPTSNKQKQQVKNGGKPQKGIAGFFSRSEGSSETKKSTKNNKDDESQVKLKVEAKETNKTVKIEKMDVDDDIIDLEKKKDDKNHGKTASQSNGTAQNKSKSKSLSQIKKNAKVDKKRKRVLHVSDSESEEEKNDPFVDEADVHNKSINIDSEDEIPPTPVVNTIKITSGILNPKKRRKIVNKTYKDEEGYILTKKEEVYESLSENEDTKENEQAVVKKQTDPPKEETTNKTKISPRNKKNGTKNKKKISPPQKGKQATLMSFFKKARL